MTGNDDAVRVSRLTKVYGSGDSQVVAIQDIDVGFARHRFTAIMGPSGSGKSTLMHCAAGLERPSSGAVLLGDTPIWDLDDDGITELRRDRIGFVFQAFNLLPTLSARENITLPFSLAGRAIDTAAVAAVVAAMGLADRLDHRPGQLSGGQQQRVACARALVTDPDVVFADEPTGALDSRASRQLLEYLRRGVDELGRTIVMVTHDPVAAGYADRVLFLADGRIVSTMDDPSVASVHDRMRSLEAVTL